MSPDAGMKLHAVSLYLMDIGGHAADIFKRQGENMKFEAYVRRLNLRKKIMWLSTPRWMRNPKLEWIRQDRSIKRTGGELLNPCVVCGAGRIQGPWA